MEGGPKVGDVKVATGSRLVLLPLYEGHLVRFAW